MIVKYSIIIFITQLLFIACRTWNVRAIATNDISGALLSGGLVHITWLVSIAIGAVSMHEILSNFRWEYLPVVICSMVGGLVGTYIGLTERST
jgi:uncharacterized membrane protein